jgi:general nucleoside transport system permease protein
MSATVQTPEPGTSESRKRRLPTFGGMTGYRWWLTITLLGLFVLSVIRVVTGADGLDSTGTLRAAVIATCPILMAGIGGLWSERAGIVNIGLEGQMILGTWGAAYFTYWYGPWQGILGAALMGGLLGLLHAIATVTFGVDHIVSGVAINIIGAGVAEFLAGEFFIDLEGGGVRQLTGLDTTPTITVPGLSDAANDLADKQWFVISDVSAFVAAMTTKVNLYIVLIVLLVIFTAWILWRTTFGLRLRSCGENPGAAESLGVNVYRYKYIAVIVSGAMAGIGGGFLALVSSSGFNVGQTGGRGYIGLAAMIFGNWTPGGTAAGAFLFGYTDSLNLRGEGTAVHALLLVVAIGALVLAYLRYRGGNRNAALIMGGFGLAFLAWFLFTDQVPKDFTGMTPYVATLLVLALASQRLRMPAADGMRYRRGQSI